MRAVPGFMIAALETRAAHREASEWRQAGTEYMRAQYAQEFQRILRGRWRHYLRYGACPANTRFENLGEYDEAAGYDAFLDSIAQKA